MNRINPKKLLHSKFTKVNVANKDKHFMVTKVTFDEQQRVQECIIQALMSQNEYPINWRELTDALEWHLGWK